MGLLDWFLPKPRCSSCHARLDGEPHIWDGDKVCESCLEAFQEKAAELEARRQAEEEARARVEGRQTFGERPPPNR